MIIIPAIDIYQQKLVKLSKEGLGSVTFYRRTPLFQAQAFEEAGFRLIHVVDMLAQKTGKFTISDSIKELKENTNLKIQLGAGIHDTKSAHEVFSAGVDCAVIGQLSVTDKKEFEIIIKNFTPGKIIADIEFSGDKILINPGNVEPPALKDHIEYCLSVGIKKIICTDISPEKESVTDKIPLYKALISSYPELQLIISGGISSVDELKQFVELDPYAVIIGRALHEGWIDIKDAAAYTGNQA